MVLAALWTPRAALRLWGQDSVYLLFYHVYFGGTYKGVLRAWQSHVPPQQLRNALYLNLLLLHQLLRLLLLPEYDEP
jgi:hypothetical protein